MKQLLRLPMRMGGRQTSRVAAALLVVLLGWTAVRAATSMIGTGVVGHLDGQVDRALVQLPGYTGLTADQKLDKAMDLPGMRGVLLGRTGASAVHQVKSRTGLNAYDIVTDYVFDVRAFYGHGSSQYRVGGVIDLRVPGGSSGPLTQTVEGAPNISENEVLFVVVRDQGEVAGGNTPAILVVSDQTDVYQVAGGVVSGQGVFASIREPVASFVKHWQR